jgi:hypothetical protein
MGSMTFLLPNPVPPAAAAAVRRACFAGGYDQTPVPTRVEIDGPRLVVSRGLNESGYLLVPWPVEPFGSYVTTTATLRERPEPYSLMVELARGKLNQVRTQTAEWTDLGLRTPPDFDRALEEATRLFGTAVLTQPRADPDAVTGNGLLSSSAESDAAAARVLEQSYVLADRLVRTYAEQVFATRHLEEGKLATRLAGRVARPLGAPESEYRRAFNAVQLGLVWRDVEPAESQYNWANADAIVASARAAGMPVTAGPIIDISPGMLPDWAAGWNGDLPTLAAFMCDFLETVIARYKGDVRRWIVCAGFNHTDGLGLPDDDRLRLAARLFEAASHADPELELVLSVAQPWGDYLIHDDQTISPLAFADDLIRTGLRVSAVELEVRTGCVPRGSLPRDLLDTSRVIDLFSVLGVPLEIVLSRPSSARPDPMAQLHRQEIGDAWRTGPSPDNQADWGATFAALALCKPHVCAVTWDHWNDADPHMTPAGGLIDPTGRPKPLLARLRSLRVDYLK